MLSARLCLNSRSFWKTNATRSIKRAEGMSRTSTSPMRTAPSATSQKRGTSEATVVLPPPEGPTKATVVPCSTENVTSESTSCAAPG